MCAHLVTVDFALNLVGCLPGLTQGNLANSALTEHSLVSVIVVVPTFDSFLHVVNVVEPELKQANSNLTDTAMQTLLVRDV